MIKPLMNLNLPRALLLASFLAIPMSARASEAARALPAPTLDEAPRAASEKAIFAGGCFWGVQGVFQHVKGVSGAVSGYAGGDKARAHYEMVSTGTTGHAESVEVTFDPRQISYGHLLRIFFSVAHDPTQLDRQGPDVGAQYRSALFPTNAEQARVARAYIEQLDKAHAFGAALVTVVGQDGGFYPAEAYHQDFLTRHPSHPYIAYNDLPKIENLKRLYPDLYREKPALVGDEGR